MDPSPDASRSSPAEERFLEYLERCERGTAEPFDELLRAHPALDSELRTLASRQQRFARLRERVLASGGADPDPSANRPRGAAAHAALTLRALAELDESRRPIERYEPGEELARGAQGVVRRAFDKSLGRTLAMKVLHRADEHAALASRGVQRFLDEAHITAGLDHPSIVPVHDLGIDRDGQPFFTMKLVRGIALGEALERHRRGHPDWTLVRLAQVLLRVAEAMAFAHDHGVLHRDLKPSNVMLGDYGEVYVMDWGLARKARGVEPDGGPGGARDDTAARAELGPTLQGDVVGTPYYMPPEQAEGRQAEVGAAADVYALGAMLYHLLAGRAPYAEPPSSSARDVLERVRAGPPAAILEVEHGVPPELEAICAKAMARAPADRYPSMRELASDLRAWLEGRVVRAYERGALADLRKWIGRNRALSATALVALLSIVGGLAYSAHVEAAGRLAAEAARTRADATLADLMRLSEAVQLGQLETRSAELWPEVPAKVDLLSAWLAEARPLSAHLDEHERTLDDLRAGRIEVAGLQRDWWESTLSKLVQDLRSFQDERIPDVERRYAFASTLEQRTLVDERAAWDEALRSIAADPRYGGLALAPIAGLVPIGRDPHSGLQEFWHLRSGARPQRDERGVLLPNEDMGLVFVLLPGGAFWMGAHPHPDAPNFDPGAVQDEQPLIEVVLDPFLMSKYEMTQGQWLRSTGSNPSLDPARGVDAGRQQTLLHPVDFVSGTECDRCLARIDLMLPTEAQWEYAARAGTRTPWWTGVEPGSLHGADNLADQSVVHAGKRWDALANPLVFADGHVLQAPVGSFAANPFGLHDVHGNLIEWTSDNSAPYGLGRRAGDGAAPLDERIRIMRGGCYYFGAAEARSAARAPSPAEFKAPLIGLRPARAIR
jgi:formylglycine-generating enzyme required for sulfatase activity